MTEISQEAVERLWERWNPGLSVTELRKDPDTQQSFREDIEAVLDVERPAIQAQVLAEVRERLEKLPVLHRSYGPKWDRGSMKVLKRQDVLATLNLSEGLGVVTEISQGEDT